MRGHSCVLMSTYTNPNHKVRREMLCTDIDSLQVCTHILWLKKSNVNLLLPCFLQFVFPDHLTTCTLWVPVLPQQMQKSHIRSWNMRVIQSKSVCLLCLVCVSTVHTMCVDFAVSMCLYFARQTRQQSRPPVVMVTDSPYAVQGFGLICRLSRILSKVNVRLLVCFPHICRRAVGQTTGCPGDRFELTSLLAGSRADTDTRPYHGNQSSPRSLGRSQCFLGFHSGQLKERRKHTHTVTSDNKVWLRNVAVNILLLFKLHSLLVFISSSRSWPPYIKHENRIDIKKKLPFIYNSTWIC